MARTFSAAGTASVLARETTEEWVILLTLSHASFSQTRRYARRSTSIVSNSNTFLPAPFNLTLPDSNPTTLPKWQISIDIVDQTVLSEMRSVATAPDIQLDVIRASTPNTIEMTTGTDYKITAIRYTNITMQAEISLEDLLGEGFPGGRILPTNFPGGF